MNGKKNTIFLEWFENIQSETCSKEKIFQSRLKIVEAIMSNDVAEFTPYEYQQKLFEEVIKKNSIIYIPTGSGKTHVAALLLKALGHQITDKLYADGAKRSFFLVNTRELVYQQSSYLRQHTPFEIGSFTGDIALDNWPRTKWESQFDAYHVLVMSAQIFLNIISHGYFELSRANLMVFDECHHASSNHPMREIMRLYNMMPKHEQNARICGLTACLLNRNVTVPKVAEEIRKLEETFCSCIISVDAPEVYERSAHPTTLFYDYEVDNKEWDFYMEERALIKSELQRVVQRVKNMNFKNKSNIAPPKFPNKKLLYNENSWQKEIANALEEIVILMDNQFGLYGTFYNLTFRLIFLEREKRKTESATSATCLEYLVKELTCLQNRIWSFMQKHDKLEQIFQFSSDKIRALISALDGLRNTYKPFSVIVFAERRMTAQILYMVLKKLGEHEEYTYIKPDFLVGQNQSSFWVGQQSLRENLHIAYCSNKTINDFRSGITNVLCASNVIDEGFDVSEINAVIMFDFPKDFRGFLQAKGRARMKNSQFILIIPGTEALQYERRVFNFLEVNNELRKIILSKENVRNVPSDAETIESFDDQEIEPYYISSTNVSCSAIFALSLLSRYCQTLHNDAFYVPQPYFYEDRTTEYVSVLLPPASKIIAPIEGKHKTNLKLAKSSAALEAIKKLHELRELDDHLLPISAKSEDYAKTDQLFKHWDTSDTEEELENPVPQTGSTQRRRIHKKGIPQAFKNCRPVVDDETGVRNNFLYVIDFNPLYQHPLVSDTCQWKLHEYMLNKNTFAILTKKKMPALCHLPIFCKDGEIEIKIQEHPYTTPITQNNLDKLMKFHAAMIKVTMFSILPSYCTFNNSSNSNNVNDYLLVPITYNEANKVFAIDFNVVERNLQYQELERTPTVEERKQLVVDSSYDGGIVMSWYKDRNFYLVKKICNGTTPSSAFPNESYRSFEHYFFCKYQHESYNKTQPLILVRRIRNYHNCLKPDAVLVNKTAQRKLGDIFEETFIPELCTLLKFPANLWYKAQFLPSILHRVSHLLLVDEFRRKLNAATRLGCIDLPSGQVWKPIKINPIFIQESGLSSKKEQALRQEARFLDNDMNLDLEEDDYDDDSADETIGEVMKANELKLLLSDFNTELKWKDEQEPVDIDRHFDTCTMKDVEYYDNFMKKKVHGDVNDETNATKNRFSLTNLAAITYRTQQPALSILDKKVGGIGPQLGDLLESFVALGAGDVLNLERSEVLGDAFLKLSASFYLFIRYPEWNEGRLTFVKGRLVSNKNLFYCAKKHNLSALIKREQFEASQNWIPPSFCIAPFLTEKLTENNLPWHLLWFTDGIPPQEQVSGDISPATQEKVTSSLLANSQTIQSKDSENKNDFFEQRISDKTLSDCVESIIGCYISAVGVRGGFQLLEYLDILPKNEKVVEFFNSPPPNPCYRACLPLDIDYHLPNWPSLEKVLGYNFKNRGFLLQALTHMSYMSNRLTNSYERLEFIGDAVLDFVITSYIYEHCSQKFSPGDLTDLRSALVNNVMFASLAVKYGFSKFMLVSSGALISSIGSFVDFQEKNQHVIDANILTLFEEGDFSTAEYVDVPKALGDIFESIIGAIFVDSGWNLHIVWKVVYNLMHEQIEKFQTNIPKNPVRLIYEAVNANPTWGNYEKKDDGKMGFIPLSFFVEGKRKCVVGYGDNRKNAKRAAAKFAVRVLETSKSIE